ncbi:AAA family ATPase [Nakamurella sp. YIM 132087]|uniref:AAA family ATPase n=1 Tax=Nakamurella alba TaxID=2665158 RepID=A0A7K1FIC0_9ACTN|nr:BTAD domain-containing putative transcriptional regulator [Nakamurella alba]MTD12634.1 AAA family ATPase [Nakamurella alba]
MQYRVLGPLEVVRDDHAVDLGGPKQRAVLAVLLLSAGRVVPTDSIIDAVWGEDAPPSVTGSLQAHISNLRRLLRDSSTATSPIVRRAPGYSLSVPAESIDLSLFTADVERARTAAAHRDWGLTVQAAEAALHRWRGTLLADWQDEEWVRIPAAGVDERRAEALELLVTGLLGSGRETESLHPARLLHELQPLRDKACWLYVLALHRAGRSGEALDVHRAHTRRLDEELGLETGPDLRELQGAILRQDPSLMAWPGPAAQPAATPTAPAIPAPHTPDITVPAEGLVGRGRELDIAAGLFAEVRTGGDRWLLLGGPAGIGKTRLAEEIVRRWESTGGRAVRTTCPDDDGVPPWWPVRRVLRGLGSDDDAVLTPPEGSDADAARFAIYERVLGLLAEVSADAGGLLLLVDDVQWADPATLRFLTHLAAAPGANRLAVLLTARDGLRAPDLQRLLESAVRRAGTRQVTVPPLSVAEVGRLSELVGGRAVDPGEAAALTARTGGNPFFVAEYARLPEEERAAGDLPPSIRSVLGRRLSALDPAVLQVLRTAAIIGDPMDPALLRSVTRIDPEELADLLDEASDERIIVAAADGRYTFAHALLRDEVMAGMSAVRRQRLHARVADSLGPGGPTERLVRRAAHLVAALPLADPATALDACRAAAVDADRRWLSEAAADWWEIALQVADQLSLSGRDALTDTERDDLVIARVDALARAGRGQTVLDVVDAALLDAARQGRTGSVGRLASTLLRTAGAWPWTTYGADPAPLLTRLAGVERMVSTDPAAHVQVLAALAVGSCYDPDGAVPDRLSAHALEIAEQLGDPEVLADALLGRALTFSGVAARAEESVRLLERLAEVPHRQQRLDDVLRHSLLAMATMTLGDVTAAEEHRRRGAEAADLLRLPVGRVQLRWMEGELAQWHGDFVTTRAIYDQTYEMHQQTELYFSGVYYHALLALLWDSGRIGELGPPDVDKDVATWALAALHAARGEAAAADRVIGEELAADGPLVWTSHGRWTLMAHLTADLGLHHHVNALLDRLVPLQHCIATMGHVGVFGPIGLAVARLHLLRGDPEAAAEPLAVATVLAENGGGPVSLARCRSLAAELEDLSMADSR